VAASGKRFGFGVTTASALVSDERYRLDRSPTGCLRGIGGHTVTVTNGRRSEQDIRSWPPGLEGTERRPRSRRDDRGDANLRVTSPTVDTPPPEDALATDETIRGLIAAHELERSRTARDLHDVVGQALTAIRLHLDLIRKDEAAGRTIAAEAHEAIELVDATLHQVRDLAFEIRPTILDDLGLVAAARACLTRQARISGFAAEFRAEVPDGLLDLEIEAACFRTLQEALTNISRHAAASIVEVSIMGSGSDLLLTVDDDGIGFSPERVLRTKRPVPSLGLPGTRERISLVGGVLAIESAPGKGTKLRASFPIRDAGLFKGRVA
jgi:signal transduction histidine kinase